MAIICHITLMCTGLKAEANLPDPMVAPDDGSLAQESGANVQGRIDVGAAVGGVRSKL